MSEQYPHMVHAVIWEPIEPLDRGRRYEDPLKDRLNESGLGEVDGGGTQLSANGEIGQAEVHFALANLGEALSSAKTLLEAQGAPVGSFLRFQRDGQSVEEPIGKVQGLFIYLNLSSLPTRLYDESDEDGLISSLKDTLAQSGADEMRKTKLREDEHALYIYGPNAEAIHAALKPILEKHTRCQLARIVFRDRGPEMAPREVVLPLHEATRLELRRLKRRARFIWSGLGLGCLFVLVSICWTIYKAIAWLFGH